jgi:hypothetical protein
MSSARLLLSFAVFASAAAAGCSSDAPTQIVVDNDYLRVEGGAAAAPMTVFKVWWATTLLPDAVGPSGEGQTQRTVPNTDYAYAVLAPGWDPDSGAPPSRFLAAKSLLRLQAVRGETLHVRVSDDTFAGDCADGKPLSQDDADLVTQRIFPGEFAGLTYDAATCVATAAPTDGGSSSDAP